MIGTRSALGTILVAVLLAYLPSLRNGYTLDDPLQAAPVLPDGSRNAMVGELRPLGDYFAADYWAGAGQRSRLYRPVTVLGYALTNAAAGGAAAHHALNVMLQLWATALAFALVRPLVRSPGPALVAALAFGLHAIHSEVVAGTVGRAELLAFCFGAQGLLALRGGTVARVAAAPLWFLAFASKESALAWPAFALVWALAAGPLAPRRRWPAAVAAAAVPLLAFLWLRAGAIAGATAQVDYLSNPLFHVDAAARVAAALQIQAFALYKTLLPLGLISEYGPVTFALPASPWTLPVVGAGLLQLALVGAAVVLARRQPLLALAVACFFGFNFLTSNLPFATGTIFGERLLYTPSLAFALVCAWIAERAGAPRTRRALAVAFAAWLVASTVTIVQRNGAWHDDAALLAADAAANPRAVRLQNSVAAQLHASADAADGERAGALWRAIIDLDPDYADALANYGAWLAVRGRYAEAETFFARALRVPAPRRIDHRVHEFLGWLYLETGRASAAATAFARVLASGDDAARRGDRTAAARRYRVLLVEGIPDAVRERARVRLRALDDG